MKTYYLDSNYRVHSERKAEESFLPWEDTDGFFNGKCHAYIEGFRVVPEGETWTSGDGVAFSGLMIAPAVDYAMLEAAQSAYEQAKNEAEAQANKRFEEVEAALVELAEMILEGGNL